MTVIDDKEIKRYLEKTIDKVFKILPLYEEKSPTLNVYINSLVIELKGFVHSYVYVATTDYLSIIGTLEGLKDEVAKEDNKSTVKRETFKSITTIRKIAELLGDD